jgi:lysophospholipase L1-like esterase
VVVFGDSLTELAASRTVPLFADDPQLRLSISYFGGTQLDTWSPAYAMVPEGSVVLVMLGVNDLHTSPSAVAAIGRATEAVDIATVRGARRVVLVTVNGTGSTPALGSHWHDKVTTYNDWLRRAARDDRRFPTLAVADWDRVSRGHTEYLQADAVHLTPAGQAAYAQLIHDAARAAV